MTVTDKVALIDLDGTVADYDAAMGRYMRLLQSPGETAYTDRLSNLDGGGKEPSHIEARRKLVQQLPGFWRYLPRLALGFEIVDELRTLGFDLHVLTKGPKKTPSAWSEKVEWCQEHLPDVSVTVGSDKSLVYGRVLVDDWPEYFEKWLDVRPRGLVVCVAHPWNADCIDPRVFRYDGTNREELRRRLTAAYERQSGNE